MMQTGSDATPLTARNCRLLGTTVLCTQLPLLFHLPLWICLPGALLVLAKIIPAFEKRLSLPSFFLTPLVMIGAVAIVMHFGDVFNRDPCVAFLFLLVGFKFLESRKNNDASLLVLLSAFLLMTQFFYWQSIIAALFSIPGIFFIGLSLFSLQRGNARYNPRFMVNLTSKLLLQAIPVAMLLFVAVPRVTVPGFGSGIGGSGVTGLSSSMSPGSISSLTKSTQVALRVEFDTSPPAASDLYWRGPVLSGFDGRNWYVIPRAQHKTYTSNSENPSEFVTTINYKVTMEPTNNPWLLALDVPAALPTRTSNGVRKTIGVINREKQLNSLVSLNRAVRYEVSSVVSDSYYSNSQPGAEYLVTTESNPEARQLATELRTQYPDDFQFANGVLKWFSREGFHYTLNPPQLKKPNSIDQFLFESRLGFCEFYAGSFVFLMRAAGIPARVVTGYQGGEINGDYMIVRQSDAHAWAEAYINGHWRRFDPTAAVAPERIENGIGESLREQSGDVISQLPWVKTMQLHWDSVNYAWQSMIIGFDSKSQSQMWKKLGLEKPTALTLMLLVIMAVLIWIALILVPWKLRRRNSTHLCQQQWHKLHRQFAKHGFIQQHGETAETYMNRLSRHWPSHKSTFGQILNAYHSGYFGKHSDDLKAQRLYALTMRQARRSLKNLSN